MSSAKNKSKIYPKGFYKDVENKSRIFLTKQNNRGVESEPLISVVFLIAYLFILKRMTKTVLNAKHITSLSRWCRRDGTEIIQTLTYKAVEPVIVFQFNLCKSSQIITGTGIKDLKLQGG